MEVIVVENMICVHSQTVVAAGVALQFSDGFENRLVVYGWRGVVYIIISNQAPFHASLKRNYKSLGKTQENLKET